LDQFSPRQSRPHFKIASIAAAGASQSKDRNDKQKTGFFDSIHPLLKCGSVHEADSGYSCGNLRHAVAEGNFLSEFHFN
jgi:hypothetical protein